MQEPGNEQAPQTEQPAPTAPVEGTPLVQGPRGTGAYELPSGALVSHEVTGDGMKQTRVYGSEFPSAAHFHAARGVATPAEMEKVANAKVRDGITDIGPNSNSLSNPNSGSNSTTNSNP